MPFVPTAGRTAVFRLAGPSRTSGSAVLRSDVSSAVLSSRAVVVSGTVCFTVVAGSPVSSPAAPSGTVDPVPQEQRTMANRVAKRTLFEM
jgi:hypothetical protein